jgi:predicted nucleic acid-binding protein
VVHLDTSFLILALVRGSSEARALRAMLNRREVVAMSSVAWCEFLCGPVDSLQVELAARIVTDRPSFAQEEAVLAAELYNIGGRRRGSLVDCMIAATAIKAEAKFVTANPRDFRGFEQAGLALASG